MEIHIEEFAAFKRYGDTSIYLTTHKFILWTEKHIDDESSDYNSIDDLFHFPPFIGGRLMTLGCPFLLH